MSLDIKSGFARLAQIRLRDTVPSSGIGGSRTFRRPDPAGELRLYRVEGDVVRRVKRRGDQVPGDGASSSKTGGKRCVN